MVIRLNDFKWAMLLEELKHSQGITAKVSEFVFEEIDSEALKTSGHHPDRNITFKDAEIYIEEFLKHLFKTDKKFHMKGVTIRGSKNLREIGGIDTIAFKHIVNYLTTLKLEKLVIWKVDFSNDKTQEVDENGERITKSRILSESYAKKTQAGGKRCQPLNLRLMECTLRGDFSFLVIPRKVDESYLNALTLTECGIEDEQVESLIDLATRHQNLKMLNLSNNKLTLKSVQIFKDNENSFGEHSQIYLHSNKDENGACINREEAKEIMKDAEKIVISC